MKYNTVTKSTLLLLTFSLLLVLVYACSKDNEITPLNMDPTGGDDVINTYDDSWRYDKAHSGVNWKTMYFVDNALLTGKFNTHHVSIDFDESNPSEGQIEAWVQLSTFNSGEPGRDNPGKCGPGYMGVDYLDTNYTVNPSTDTAWFHSTSIQSFGDEYLAQGELTFRGVTKTQEMYFTYLGQKDYSESQDGSNVKAGFIGEFSFLARTDYNVPSTSIADKVTVTINVNMRKN